MEKMRAGTDSFAIQALFVVIVVSFVFWGVGGSGPTSTTVATINGDRITDTEFQKEMRRYTGGRTVGDAEYANLSQQVLTSMIEQHLLLEEADRLGLEVSDDEVLREIYGIEGFQRDDGSFSLEMYERYLKLAGTEDVKFRKGLYEALLAQKVLMLAEKSVQIGPQTLKARYIEENTKLELTWFKVSDAAFMSEVEISDDEVAIFAAANPTRIEASYNAQFERRFNEPRKATLHTILLRTDIEGVENDAVKARLDGIRAELEGGAEFTDMALRWSEDLTAGDGGDVGTQAEDQLAPAVAAAVFAAEAGQLTEIIETARGFQLFFVDEIIEAKVTSLEEATPLLAREIMQGDAAPDLAKAFAEELLADWTSTGELPLEKTTAKLLFPSTEGNLALNATTVTQIGSAGEILADARKANSGDVLPKVYNVGLDRYVVQLSKRDDADMEAYETEKDGLRTRMLFAEQQSFVAAYKSDLVSEATIERFIKPQI